MQLHSDPVTLDLAKAEDGVALKVLALVSAGLIEYEVSGDGYGEAGRAKLALAQSFKILNDGRALEFELRQGCQWSDGKPLLASEFVDGFKKAVDPSVAAPLGHFLKPIRSVSLNAATQAESVHSQLLRIELEDRLPSFYKRLGLPTAFPVRQGVANDGTVTLGRYFIFSRDFAKKEITLHRNDASCLWKTAATETDDKPLELASAPKVIIFKIVSDESVALNLFRSGALDVLTRFSSLDLKSASALGRVVTAPFAATYYLGFNHKNLLLSQKPVRQLISRSIDKKQLVTALMTNEEPAMGWVHPTVGGCRVGEPKKPTGSWWQPNKMKGVFGLAFDQNNRNQLVAEKLQFDLKKANLPVVLEPRDWRSHLSRLKEKTPDLFRMAWLGGYPDALAFLQLFESGNASNFTGWSSPAYDQVIRDISEMGEQTAEQRSQRRVLVEKACGILNDEKVIEPLFYYNQIFLLSNRVKNFKVNQFGTMNF